MPTPRGRWMRRGPGGGGGPRASPSRQHLAQRQRGARRRERGWVRGSCASVGRTRSSSPAGGTTAAARRRRGSSLDAVVVPLAGRYAASRACCCGDTGISSAARSSPGRAFLLPLPSSRSPRACGHHNPTKPRAYHLARSGEDAGGTGDRGRRGEGPQGNRRADDTACSCPHKGPPPEHTTLSM
jgi:hypothetical protein